jgi:hypothetical protein
MCLSIHNYEIVPILGDRSAYEFIEMKIDNLFRHPGRNDLSMRNRSGRHLGNQSGQSRLVRPNAIEKPSANDEVAHDCVQQIFHLVLTDPITSLGQRTHFKIVAQADIQSYVVDVDVNNFADLGSLCNSVPMTQNRLEIRFDDGFVASSRL